MKNIISIRISLWVRCFLLIAFVSGCTAPKMQVSRPTKRIKAESRALDSDVVAQNSWGTLFAQPELNIWIQNALLSSPALAVMRAEERVASANVDAAGARRTPSLDASITLRTGEEQGMMTGGERADLSPAWSTIDGSWELDVFGSIRSTVGAARYTESAAQHLLQNRKLWLASEMASHYVQGISQRDIIQLRSETVVAQKKIRGYFQGRMDAGLVKHEDLAEQEAILASKQAEFSEAKEVAEVLEARWAYLSADANTLKLSAIEHTLPSIPRVPDNKDLHALVLERPDVRAAFAVATGFELQAKAAACAKLPLVTAVAQAESDWPSPAADDEEWVAWAGLRLSIPVLNPEKKASSSVAKHEAIKERALYDDIVEKALMNLRETYAKRIQLERQYMARQRESNQRHVRLDSLVRQHKAGLIPIAEMELGRLAWLTSKEREIVAYTAVLKAHISFIYTAGGLLAFE